MEEYERNLCPGVDDQGLLQEEILNKPTRKSKEKNAMTFWTTLYIHLPDWYATLSGKPAKNMKLYR